MKMRFEFAGSMAAVAAAMLLPPVSACVAETAGEVFAEHREEIATNRCVAVGGYVFGVGRAISRNGGDSAGFAKARLLAQAKILDYYGAERMETSGLQTVFEKREAPEHYMAVVAVDARFEEPRLRGESGAEDGGPRPQESGGAIEEYEPRGYWEESGVKANETLSEAQFL